MDTIASTNTYSSAELISKVLNYLGLEREEISTYQNYILPNGSYLRLRISNHGVNLSTWFKKNKEQRKVDPSLPKLNKSTNIAITFSPNKEECVEKGIDFPQKAINKTNVKTDAGNNVKPQFSVGHIQYASWLLTDNDIELIAAAITVFTESGIYTDPLGLSSGKIVAWNDTSNLPPQKLSKRTNTIKLKESDLRIMVKECVRRFLLESYTKRKVGGFDAVDGDKEPHNIGKISDTVYDVVMYSKPSKTYCVFSIGEKTNRFVCCNLDYDKQTNEWLGFTPISANDVPKEIISDLKRHYKS